MSDPSAAPDRRREEPRHPIRVVSTRTGLSPSALRAWERRYGVVDPDRSEGGQRLYSDVEVERLLLLKRVTDAGRSIGDVATLPLEEIRRLADEDERARRRAAGISQRSGPAAPASLNGTATRVYLESALEAVRQLQAERLESVLKRAAAAMGGVAFMEDVTSPLLREVGEMWARGELRPAHEHVATGVVRRVLNWMADPMGEPSGPSIVIGTLPGEEHELGALLAASAAALDGWAVTFLGPDLPPEEFAAAANGVEARAVGVSVARGSDGDARQHLRALRRALPADVELIVGGGGAAAVVDGQPGMRQIDTLPELLLALRELRDPDA